MQTAAHQLKTHFAPIPVTFATDPTISTSAKAAFIALASHRDYRTGTCWPSIARLAGQTGLSDETVSRALLELESTGWISRQVRRAKNGRWNGYLYTVHMEAQPPGNQELEPIPTAPGFSGTGKDWQEQEPKNHNEKEHTPTTDQIPEAPTPCVSPSVDEKPAKVVYLVRKTEATKDIGQAILDAINRQVTDGTEAGKIHNPAGYRRTLLSLAAKGEYVRPETAQASSSSRTDETRQWLDAFDRERQAQTDEDRQAVKEMLARFNRKGKS